MFSKSEIKILEEKNGIPEVRGQDIVTSANYKIL